MAETPFLDGIQQPEDVQKLNLEELSHLAREIREEIMQVVMKNGGHLGSNLGVVDLTLAIYKIFDIRKDLIIWDGSYQTYAHKLLTGRRERFHTLRKFGGVCGFGWKPESEFDPFNFGHVGTSLATAYGCTVADHRMERDRRVVSIIGDGSMTSGVAYEALNNIGHTRLPMTVILNDNGFSIAKTVGALSSYFQQLRTAPLYDEAKKEIHKFLQHFPGGKSVESMLEGMRRGLKQSLFPNMFTALGFQYYGPIDGHDLSKLTRVLQNVKHQDKPVLLHVVTQKGKGHPDAGTDPYGLHKAVEVKVPTGAKLEPEGKEPPIASKSYTRAFVDALTDLSEKDPKIVAITAAMPDGTGLVDYEKKFPGRVYDVGISEQCAVGFAAGLAHSGLRPVCAIYSSFSQRAYDIVFQEMCLNNLPVTLVLDRAGIAGEDGPTHHGNFDIAFLRTFPNITLMAPKDEKDVREMLALATRAEGPVVIRLPREKTPSLEHLPHTPVEIGKGEILREGKDGAILGYGVMVARALEAADMLQKEGIEVTVANARFAKPIDTELACRLVQNHPWVLTVEDHACQGGFGSAVLEELALRNEDSRKIHLHAIPDRFLQHADREELVHYLHLDGEGIADVCRMIIAKEPAPQPDPEQRKHFFYEG